MNYKKTHFKHSYIYIFIVSHILNLGNKISILTNTFDEIIYDCSSSIAIRKPNSNPCPKHLLWNNKRINQNKTFPLREYLLIWCQFFTEIRADSSENMAETMLTISNVNVTKDLKWHQAQSVRQAAVIQQGEKHNESLNSAAAELEQHNIPT